MARKKIPPLDLMFFLTETPESPKHVVAVQIFQLPSKAPKTYLKNLVDSFKKTPVAPPFNYRPHFPRTGMPEWWEDKDLDIDYHVRHSALPKPGTDRQLSEVVQRLHSGLLDRHRPGWLCQIIEGLEGGRFAIYSKIHHAYIDGMSGVRRMYGSLSTSPGEKTIIPAWSHSTSPPSGNGRRGGAVARVGRTGRAAIAQARAVTELYESMAKMGLQLLKLREGKAQIPFNAPRTRMNRPVKWDTRSFAVCTLPLDRARAVGAKLGGKVNDVVLTVIDAALHDYLEQHGENTDTPLVAMCPMSVREKGDESANTQATALHVRLGEPGAAIRDRLQQVIDSSTATKEEARAMSREALTDFALIMIGAWELLGRSGLDQAVSPSYNVLVSNVPGPGTSDMYLRGSRLLASYPISAFLAGVNLNATVLSHGNSLDFGLLADKHAMPDLDIVVQRMKHRFAELERDVLGSKCTGARAATKKSGPTGSACKSTGKAKTRARAKGRVTATDKTKAPAKGRKPARTRSRRST